MQKSSKNWGGERRLQLERRRKLRKLQQETLRGPVDAPDAQREALILEGARQKHGTNFPVSDYNPRLRCSFVIPSMEEFERTPVHQGLDSLDWSCI